MGSTSAQCLVVGALLSLTGCGGKVLVERTQLESEAGGSNSTGVNGAAGGATTRSSTCKNFVADEALSVPVLIRNDLTYPIFIGPQQAPCAEVSLFDVRDAAGRLLNGPEACRPSCEAYLSGDKRGGCSGTCPSSRTIRIDPGRSYSTSWAGLFDVDVDSTHECAPARSDALDGAAECQHRQVISAGVFTFSARAGSAVDCQHGPCDCAPDVQGTCTTPPGLVRGVPLTTGTTVELSATRTSGVTLAFDHGP